MSQTKQNKTKSAPVMMEGAEVILKVLEDQGVDVIFGYPGGAVLPIYDAIFRNNKIRHVLVRHEQAAVHAAEGYMLVLLARSGLFWLPLAPVRQMRLRALQMR